MERYLRLVLLECVTWAGAGCHKAEGERVRQVLTILQVLVPKLDGGVDHAADQLGRRGWVCRVGGPVVALSKGNGARVDTMALDLVGESRSIEKRLSRDGGLVGGMDGSRHDGAISWTTSRSTIVCLALARRIHIVRHLCSAVFLCLGRYVSNGWRRRLLCAGCSQVEEKELVEK